MNEEINKAVMSEDIKKESKWTEEQIKAISITDNNMIVSASAGSGKTTVMIERVNHILEIKDIDRIIMLTFSNASALDMKKKLQESLIKQCLFETDSIKRDKIIASIDNINISEISTIDSFCKNLLKKYFNEVNIDPAFDILEKGGEYQQKALSNTIEKYLEKADSDFLALYNSLLEKRSDKKLRENILKIDSFLSVQTDYEQFIREKATRYYTEDIYKNEIAYTIINYYRKKVFAYREKLEDIKALNNGDPSGFNTIGKFEEFFEAFEKDWNLKDFKNFLEEFGFLKDRIKDNQQLKDETDYLKKIIKNIIIAFNDDLDDLEAKIERTIKTKPYIEKLLEVVCEYKKEYSRLKKESNLLDFADLENYTCKILQNKNIRDEIRSNYDFVFIDEYQDINYVQEYIIASISDNNLFMVGDPKQCIYQFRLSEPGIFLNRYDEYKNDNIVNHQVDFYYNFRSSQDILDIVNDIFSSIMTKESCGIDYISNSMLKTKIEYKTDENYKACNIVILQYDKEENEKEKAKHIYSVKEDNRKQDNSNIPMNAEADYIYSKIADMKANCKIYTKNDKGIMDWRPLKYSDFAILSGVKKGGNISYLLERLRSHGLPVNSSGFSADKETPDILVLINYLKVLDNINQDIPLLSVMISPYGGFTFNELAQIKLDCYDNSKPFYYQMTEKRSLTDDSLGNKIKDLYRRLQHDRIYANTASVYDLFLHFVDAADYSAYLVSQKGGRERMKTLDNFVNSLYGKSYGGNICDFLDYYENYSSDEDFFKDDSEDTLDSVKVSTIHSSKGLEYPIVFLIDIDHQFNQQDFYSNQIFCDKNFGISMPYYDSEEKVQYPSLLSDAIIIKKKQEFLEERMRVFYVAMTRAKNHLFVLGVNKKGEFGAEYKDNILSFKDWLSNIYFEKSNFRKNIEIIEIQNKEKDSFEEKGGEILYAYKKADSQTVQAIKNVVNYKYQFIESTKLPVKYTVTELNDKEERKNILTASDNTENENEENDILSVSDGYIERGIIYHKIMQHIDLSHNTIEDIENDIAHMIIKAIISKEDYEKIDINEVLKCLNSSIIRYAAANVYKREKSFIYKTEAREIIDNTDSEDSVLIQGTVDLMIFDRDGKITLIDYKASRKTKEEIINTYKTQIDLYAKVIESVYNRKVDKKIIYIFGSGKEIEM